MNEHMNAEELQAYLTTLRSSRILAKEMIDGFSRAVEITIHWGRLKLWIEGEEVVRKPTAPAGALFITLHTVSGRVFAIPDGLFGNL
jgi:hypothetical protein